MTADMVWSYLSLYSFTSYKTVKSIYSILNLYLYSIYICAYLYIYIGTTCWSKISEYLHELILQLDTLTWYSPAKVSGWLSISSSFKTDAGWRPCKHNWLNWLCWKPKMLGKLQHHKNVAANGSNIWVWDWYETFHKTTRFCKASHAWGSFRSHYVISPDTFETLGESKKLIQHEPNVYCPPSTCRG